MREIEVKAKLTNTEAIVAALQERGCALGEANVQDDVVYAERSGSMEEFLGNDIFLRIRETGGRIIFTLKKHKNRAADSRSMPIEHEVTVDSRAELEAMLALLGYSEVIHIKKSRRTGKCGEYEVCLDEVEGLGSFIELEHLAEHDTDTEPVRLAMHSFLAGLGIPEEDIGAQRYDIAMLAKRFSSA